MADTVKEQRTLFKPEVKNAFTGEKLMRDGKPENIFNEKRKAGLLRLAEDEAQLMEYGEPHPVTGKRQTRPKSVGTVYDIPPDNGTYCPDKVDPTGAEATDINKIMERIDPAGRQFSNAIAQGLQTDAGMYYDNFIDAPTFQEAQNLFIHATQQFDMLPAKLRNKFENNPAEFLRYVNDPANLEESYQLGIRVKKVEPEKDATNRDVINAIRETAKGSKKTPKGEDSDG